MTFNFMQALSGHITIVPPAAPVPGWTSKNPGEAQALFATYSRTAGGAAATAAAPMTTLTSHIAASRMLHGRLPTEQPADMSLWAETVLDERTGLVVEVGAPGADVHAPSSLNSRRHIYGVRDDRGAEIGLVQILKDPARKPVPDIPGAKGATLRVHSALAKRGDSLDIQLPEYRLDHLRLRGTTSGALSPEDTLEIVEYMERYRRDEPSRSVMVLGSSRGDASAQLAIAAQLYELRRDGELRAGNLKDELLGMCERLSQANQTCTPASPDMVASLLEFGDMLLARRPPSLVPPPPRHLESRDPLRGRPTSPPSLPLDKEEQAKRAVQKSLLAQGTYVRNIGKLTDGKVTGGKVKPGGVTPSRESAPSGARSPSISEPHPSVAAHGAASSSTTFAIRSATRIKTTTSTSTTHTASYKGELRQDPQTGESRFEWVQTAPNRLVRHRETHKTVIKGTSTGTVPHPSHEPGPGAGSPKRQA